MWHTTACRVQTKPVWELRKPWGLESLGSTNVEGGLHSPFPVKTKLDKVTQNYQLLCTFSQEPILVRCITSWTKMPLETYSRSEQTKPFGDHQDHPPTMGVGYLSRFQGRLLPYTNTGTVQDISNFMSRVRHTSSKHCLGLSTAPMELTVVANELKLMAIHTGIIIHQYLDDWLVKATSHQVCLQHTLDLVKICQVLGWLVNLEKSELEPKAGLQPCR